MERIRKGNDIAIKWEIFIGSGADEAPYNLTGRNLSLYIRSLLGKTKICEYSIKDNIIQFVYRGKDQKHTGKYSLELVENSGKEGMHTVDECDAFELVRHTCEIGGDSEGHLQLVSLQFRTNVGTAVAISEGGNVTVDDFLSLESKNPVQNKVITAELESISKDINKINKDKVDNDSLAKVATSGSYNDLKEKPSIPTEITEEIISE